MFKGNEKRSHPREEKNRSIKERWVHDKFEVANRTPSPTNVREWLIDRTCTSLELHRLTKPDNG